MTIGEGQPLLDKETEQPAPSAVGGDVITATVVDSKAVAIGAGAKASYVEVIIKQINNFLQGDTEAQRAFRNRQNMLQLVWNTWIEGVLKKSLYNEMLIELGMETKPDAVEHPWDMVIQMPDREPRMVAQGTTMLELFDQANGSLLILGEPGSGKTTMLLELARQAIERAQEDPTQPIPVVFNLSSWTPKLTIADWLVDELRGKYYISQKIGRPWVENDELLLLLDGLDEVKVENRKACIEAINAFRVDHNVQLAIGSRAIEYSLLDGHLKVYKAVRILPLTNAQVDKYLQGAGSGLVAIHQALKSDLELQEFVKNPLMLSILVMVYCNTSKDKLRALETGGDNHKFIFDSYIEEMFNRRGLDSRYTPIQTRGWLAWIASSMIEHGKTSFHLEEILPNIVPLYRMKPIWVYGLFVGLLNGLIFALLFGTIGGVSGRLVLGVLLGLDFGLVSGMIIVLNFSPTSRWTVMKPTERLSWSWPKGRIGLYFGLGGLLYGLLGLLIMQEFGLVAGLASVFIGLIIGLLGGLQGSAVQNRNAPGDGIKASLKYALLTGLLFGLIGALLSVPIFSQIYGLQAGLLLGLVNGLSAGFIIGLIFGGGFLLTHLISHWLLYRSGHIPWNLVAFIDYCTDRIFLRRVGGGYIFIHRMLMEHFAKMAEGTTN